MGGPAVAASVGSYCEMNLWTLKSPVWVILGKGEIKKTLSFADQPLNKLIPGEQQF
jgi:hypothetical protein